MPKIPGCPTASGHILQYASQRAFLDTLTHNPLCSRRYITVTELLREHRGPGEQRYLFKNRSVPIMLTCILKLWLISGHLNAFPSMASLHTFVNFNGPHDAMLDGLNE